MKKPEKKSKAGKIINLVPPGITAKVQKAKLKSMDSKADWIDALSQTELLQGINHRRAIAKQVTLKLGVQDWTQIASGAAIYGWTIDQAVQFLFEAHMDCLDWFNDEFALTGRNWLIRNSECRPIGVQEVTNGKGNS